MIPDSRLDGGEGDVCLNGYDCGVSDKACTPRKGRWLLSQPRSGARVRRAGLFVLS